MYSQTTISISKMLEDFGVKALKTYQHCFRDTQTNETNTPNTIKPLCGCELVH